LRLVALPLRLGLNGRRAPESVAVMPSCIGPAVP